MLHANEPVMSSGHLDLWLVHAFTLHHGSPYGEVAACGACGLGCFYQGRSEVEV